MGEPASCAQANSVCLHAEQTHWARRQAAFGDSARIDSFGFVDDMHFRFAFDPLGRVWPKHEALELLAEMLVVYPPPLVLERENVGTDFEYLETNTRYATPGFAFCVHKELAESAGQGMYRMALITSATDGRAAVQRLANTFMRMFRNCTFPTHAVECMRRLGRRVQAKANFSGRRVEAAWRSLAQHPRYARYCHDLVTVWQAQ